MKKSTNTLLAAAVSGLFLGGASSCTSGGPDMETRLQMAGEKHACKGLNSCQGKGGCKTAEHACAGKNSCKTKGGCATVEHACASKNECKGQGGCKSGDNGCAGKNSCKGNGGCKSPVSCASK